MVTVGLSHPRAITPIPDPVHDRMEFTIFDRDLIDSSLFQRLHFVLQNSVNFFSFPANKNTRFPHSLGTAHICGRLFSEAVSNSDAHTLNSFLKSAAGFIQHVYTETAKQSAFGQGEDEPTEIHKLCENAHQKTISGRSRFLHAPLSQKHAQERISSNTYIPGTEFTAGFVIDTLWQALRHYALAHDLGHLPMSHAFETALSQTGASLSFYDATKDEINLFNSHLSSLSETFHGIRKWPNTYHKHFSALLKVNQKDLLETVSSKEIHEVRSIFLYNVFSKSKSNPTYSLSPSFGQQTALEIRRYNELIHRISLCISMAPAITNFTDKNLPPHEFSFLDSLRRIVDGRVDGDRLDYTMRDLLESGVGFGRYDLERIIKNSLLVSCEKNNRFAFGFYHRAIPGIEQFFESRYQGYKYVIFHRAALRSNKCMEHLLTLLFTHSYKYPQQGIAKILSRYGYLKMSEENKIEGILPAAIDFIERIEDNSLRSMLYEVQDEIRSAEKSLTAGRLLNEINSVCKIILFRDFSGVATAFKDKSTADVLKSAIPDIEIPSEERNNFTKHLYTKRKELMEKIRKDVYHSSKSKYDKPISVIFDIASPKKVDIPELPFLFEEQVWIEDRFGRRVPALNFSSGLRASAKKESKEVIARVYAIYDEIKRPESSVLAFVEERCTQNIMQEWSNWKNEMERQDVPT